MSAEPVATSDGDGFGRIVRHELLTFRDRHSPPAIGGAVVTRVGLVDIAAVGTRVRGAEDDPVAPDDRWHIGSCGKAMTAALFARLVERGEADWAMPVPEVFPDLAGGLDKGWSATTIDDLFVSESGLPANLTRAALAAAYTDSRPVVEQRTEVARTALASAPRSPGRFVYSNLGYMVIGAAIERITGTPYESALAAHVLEPLEITSCGFGAPPDLWGHGGRMLALGPLGVVDFGRGRPADPASAGSDNPPVMSPAGRMHLALEDWARFLRIFLTDGGGFLRPDTIDLLLTPRPGTGQRQARGWAPAAGWEGASLGQQGSNTFWVATALLDTHRERAALVVCNEGRSRLLKETPVLAGRLLASAPA